MKIRIKSTTRLTQVGMAGALFFVAGPLVAMFFGAVYVTAPVYRFNSGNKDVFGLLSVIGVIAFLVGYVLLAVGKETISVALSGDDVPRDE